MEKVYYNNIECLLIAKLDSNESVIEIDTAMEEYEDEFEIYAEPITRRIVVRNKDLTLNKINKDNILQELEKYKEEQNQEINKKKNEILSKARIEKAQLEKEVKELKHKFKNIQVLNEMYNYICGNYKYFVGINSSYGKMFGIKSIKEQKCDYDKYKLASVSFRTIDYTGKITDDFKIYLGQYSDDIGSHGEVKGFKTKKEALEFLINEVENNEKININSIVVSEFKRLNILDKSNRVQQYIKEEDIRNKKRNEEEIIKLQNRLTQLKDNK